MPHVKQTTMTIAMTLTACAVTLGAFATPAQADLGGATASGVRAVAIITADGHVVRSKGVIGARKIAVGQYCVRLDSDINPASTVPVATAQWSGSWGTSVHVRPDNFAACGDSRDVFVGIGTAAAGARDTGFHLIVP
ncbi:hypothetical protein Ssi03_56770 [Sphaerisporangium siamense]|uniref:Uncharacterized protein n=1 Tax=Sphaerisporangium siamense TaxID=795645 RepID=A0A7W7D4Z5_9ACTN|nr:hypothetical protein [Sphaerisporangium siamense]MBB4700272.1 hypothetical protein [Sphaerisporangium siamense]GII87687.1 hypothetical protein Ssi03_56770 [Sphaerisporangium siamense]